MSIGNKEVYADGLKGWHERVMQKASDAKSQMIKYEKDSKQYNLYKIREREQLELADKIRSEVEKVEAVTMTCKV